MLAWYKQETKVASDEFPDWNYVLDVWIPEAIVYAIIRLKKYTRKKAWQRFEKGVYITKKERAEVYKSRVLESAKRISPEDVQRYKENLKDRMNVICQRSGLQNIIL
ncbi:uncharacterized protein LOC134260880 [Saccostrea cucullata]|uniref:uncharacterized protein LOC134260880 n=1 Tax=Saccostrea cuccullata TaxID=36930 RepID=UPI002ED30D74